MGSGTRFEHLEDGRGKENRSDEVKAEREEKRMALRHKEEK